MQRPLAEHAEVAFIRPHVDCHQAARVRPLVEADAAHAVQVRVDARVVVAEEARTRTRACDELVEPGCLAHESLTATVTREPNARGRVVREEEIEIASRGQQLDLVARVVSLGGAA